LSDYKNIESAKAQASNWILGKNIPNPIDFARLKTILPIAGEYEDLRREYEDLRREYEDLRREYEDLRRPFSVTRFDPFTDVWTFATVKPRPGKHPCEKPQSLLRHIINSSTRPGAVVLDSFAGSGSTGQACLALGRQFVGIERCHHWYAVASESLKSVQPDLLTPSPQQRISSSAAAGHQPSLALA
jgi:DNA modification methylase